MTTTAPEAPGITRPLLVRIGGMHCAGCVQSVERALKTLPHVTEVSVNLATETARLVHDGAPPSEETLAAAVGRAGFTAELVRQESGGSKRDLALEDARKLAAARRRMLLAWALVAPAMIAMVPEMASGVMWPSPRAFHAIMLLLALPPVFVSGWPTLKSAFSSARVRAPNMDVLIAIGTLAALATGVLALLGTYGVGPHVYDFSPIAAMIMAFHLTGRFIEARARGRASQAIRRLLLLEARSARVVRDGVESDVPLSEVRVNDVMIVRPGEKVPTDGLVLDGRSTIDESMVTGESMPVVKARGDIAIGSTVNTSGLLRVRATGVGENTLLAQIVRLVEEAQTTNVPIQVVADRVTGIFVPFVLTIAALTFVAWMVFPEIMQRLAAPVASRVPWMPPHLDVFSRALFAAMATLVIACPCALGLATPTALMVGSGIGAANGVLIRRGEAVQRMREVTVVVFDKTGTITLGSPAVAEVRPEPGREVNEVLRIAAAAEAGSEHPLARAIVAEARARSIEEESPSALENVPGEGLEARTRHGLVRVGTRAFVLGGSAPAPSEGGSDARDGDPRTWVWVAVDGRLAGSIALADRVRDDAKASIDALRALGIEPMMLTGDNAATAGAVAKAVGIERVRAGVLPKDKVDAVKELQAAGSVVAMVGDGINDAPALAQADVGLAVSTGTDVAVEAGDIVLVGGDLRGVLRALRLSQATFQKIRQNLFWAFFYNLVALPAAMLGLLHPLIAEAAMALSSVNVVLNAQRLNRLRL